MWKTALQTFLKKNTDFFKYGIENLCFHWTVVIENEADYIFEK